MMIAPSRLTETVCIRSQERTHPHQFVVPRVGLGKLPALVAGVALLATACGSGASSPELGGIPNSPSTEVSAVGSETGDGGADAGTEARAESTAGSTGEEAAGPVEPTLDHLFPDVDVLDIQTGATLNIATELAGGDRPVLLWFWAPH